MKNKTFLTAAILLIAGLGLMVYPLVSDMLACFRHSETISSYTDDVMLVDHSAMEKMFSDAEQYNAGLRTRGFRMKLREDMLGEYEGILNPSGNGMIGYIEIPKINVRLPLYHGMDESVLASGAGHITGSSLPTGGEGNHTVIAGHSGLTSARLFTSLDELEKGDRFCISVLDRRLLYEVDQINTVRPEETELLEPVQGQDLCTLITCTPYGVNSHRLLVRGKRVFEESASEEIYGSSKNIIIAAAIACSVIAFAFMIMILLDRHGKKRRMKNSAG